MPPTLRSGLILGFSVAAWTFVNGFTGWYKHPSLKALFWLVVPIQVGILIWSLRGSARVDGYGRQVWNGVSISLLGSTLIYGFSLLFTTVVFPHYFQDMDALGRQLMAQRGLSAEQIEAAVRVSAPMQTPRASAMTGVVGTMFTGLFTSLIAAIWLRRK